MVVTMAVGKSSQWCKPILEALPYCTCGGEVIRACAVLLCWDCERRPLRLERLSAPAGERVRVTHHLSPAEVAARDRSVLEVVRANPDCTATLVCTVLGMPPGTVRSVLKRRWDRGLGVKRRSVIDGKKTTYRWSVTT